MKNLTVLADSQYTNFSLTNWLSQQIFGTIAFWLVKENLTLNRTVMDH